MNSADMSKKCEIEPRTAQRTKSYSRPWQFARLVPVRIAASFADLLIISFCGPLASKIYDIISESHTNATPYFGISLLLACCLITWLHHKDLYSFASLVAFERQIKTIAPCWIIALIFVVIIAFFIKSSADLSRGVILTFTTLGLSSVFCLRIWWARILRSSMTLKQIKRGPVALVIISPGTENDLSNILNQKGFHISRKVVISHGEPLKHFLIKRFEDLRGTNIKEIIINLSIERMRQLDDILEAAQFTPLPVRLIPDQDFSRLMLHRHENMDGLALLELKREPLTPLERFAKRCFDVVVASIGLVLLLPLLMLTGVLIKIDSAGPIIFMQTRRGYHGRQFRILKFRTMNVMEDGGTVVQAVQRDKRVTRIGRILRKSSIDELPQLWNVLKGDMSLVGPRPHAVAHDLLYERLLEHYPVRHHVKPGLTGWAQVNGWRGETPKMEMMEERVRHDLWYVSNWSFSLDVRIMLATCSKLIASSAY